jgi:hypothetical protein
VIEEALAHWGCCAKRKKRTKEKLLIIYTQIVSFAVPKVKISICNQ